MWAFVKRNQSVVVPIVLVFIAGVTIAIVGYSLISDPENRDDYWLEVGTAGLQLGIVSVIGTGIAIALQNIEANRERTQRELDLEREERRLQSEYRLDFLRRLRTAYGDTKRARRHLEAAGLTNKVSPSSLKDKVTALEYTTAMRVVNDAQLDLEALRDELTPVLGDHPAAVTVKQHLDTMEKYLNRLVTEHNLAYLPATRRKRSSIDFGGLCELQAFTHADASTFRQNFARPYHAVVRKLHSASVEPRPRQR